MKTKLKQATTALICSTLFATNVYSNNEAFRRWVNLDDLMAEKVYLSMNSNIPEETRGLSLDQLGYACSLFTQELEESCTSSALHTAKFLQNTLESNFIQTKAKALYTTLEKMYPKKVPLLETRSNIKEVAQTE